MAEENFDEQYLDNVQEVDNVPENSYPADEVQEAENDVENIAENDVENVAENDAEDDAEDDGEADAGEADAGEDDAENDAEDYSGVVEEKKWPGWPGENVFRMLVPVQRVGGIIGRKGEYIKKICEETKARIKILDGPPGTTERTVLQIKQDFNLSSGFKPEESKIQIAALSIEHYKC